MLSSRSVGLENEMRGRGARAELQGAGPREGAGFFSTMGILWWDLGRRVAPSGSHCKHSFRDLNFNTVPAF